MGRIFIFLVFLFTFAFGDNGAKKLQDISLQLHWRYQFEFAGFIAAQEKGFYKDVGLNVHFHEYHIGTDIEKVVLAHDATYGIYNSSTLIDYLKGKPLVLVASFFKRSALVLVTQPDIHTPKDLIGKTLMGSTRKDLALNFMPYFDVYGLKLDNINLVPHTYTLEPFINKEVDAMTAFRSDQLYQLDKLGIAYNVLDPSEENLYVLQEELFTSQKEVSLHPLRVEKFRDASIRGWQYALKHKKELVHIIHQKYAPEISEEELMAEAKAIEKLILPFTYEIGSIDESFLKKQKDYFINYYHIDTNKTLQEFVFHSYIMPHIHFTQEEIDYIKQYKDIKVCVNYDLFPLDGVKNGKMIGEMADFYHLIESKTSLHFIPVASSSDEEFHKNIQEKKCAMLSITATVNEPFFPTLRFTPPFNTTHFTLISKLDKSFVYDATELRDKILMVQKKSFKHFLLQLYPFLHIRVQENKNKMIHALFKEDVDAIVTLDEQADYIINQYGYGKLKINGFLAKNYPFAGTIGVQKEEKLLFSILKKVLDIIPYQQIQKIENSWRLSRYQTRTDYSVAIKLLFFMGIIFLLMFYYQRKLKNFNKKLENIVYEKTKELREVNETLEATVEEKVQELIKKDKILTLQSKQAVMGEMLSMIAHQWRQPLNTITLQISNLQLQKMLGNTIGEEKLMRTLEEINNTIVYLSDTIDDFKTYFHPNKKATTIHMHELIQKVLVFIEPRIKSKNITLKLLITKDIVVQTYVNELIQVLLNILNNAIDAYESQEVSYRPLSISVKKEDETLKISIADNAGGIAQEHIEHIFDPYFSTKGKNGTGLGLYMSQMIIEKQFFGKIYVESEAGATIFYIEIPLSIKHHEKEDDVS